MSQVAAFAHRPRPALGDGETSAGFCDRVAQLLDRIDYRLADSGEAREAIFRLRYQAYVREGAISPNFSKTFSDPYDESQNAWLFGVYLDGELAGSMRLHVGSREYPDFPSLHVFPDLLQPEIDGGKVILDSTRFVTDAALSRVHRGLPYVTLRLCWLAVQHFRVDHFLAAVRGEHQPFYRRTFRHEPVCEPRVYPMLAKPISLMNVNYLKVAEEVQRRYPFFRSTLFERRMLFEPELRFFRQAANAA